MENYIVFSLQSNQVVAEKVAKKFGVELGVVSIDNFADGEVLVKSLSDVKDKNVAVEKRLPARFLGGKVRECAERRLGACAEGRRRADDLPRHEHLPGVFQDRREMAPRGGEPHGLRCGL